ncbi:hypothetical protein [Actinoplanes awajinensis]|uniref:hypothetical protein n=1 Tax=Actinoplanes awajinensis TaxID=135946 RepID=UPI001E653138|nr:hypothetical protein [Actinoplanes awajinensis]
MSLSVRIWIPDENAHAGRRLLDDPPRTGTSAGSEFTRHQLWGSTAARRLGATFLPQLGEITLENRGNLMIPPDRLDAFEQECRHLAEHAGELAAATGYEPGYITDRLATIRNAVDRARAANGSILIW